LKRDVGMSLFLINLKKILNDSLYKNSLFLVLSRVLNMASGFFFWVLAAKLYSIQDVGMATALRSSVGLVILMSRFGFDFSLIRYAPNNDKRKIFSTCFVITTVLAIFISLLYFSVDQLLNISLIHNSNAFLAFLLFAISESIFLITGNMFWALRKANHYFVQNIILSLRVMILFTLIDLNSLGVFMSMGICYLLSSIYALIILNKYIKIGLSSLDKKFLKDSSKFSMGNFFSNNLYEAPVLILPIMVLHLLGDDHAAKYYIAFMIGNLSLIVPSALSISLFVEGSHDEPLRKNAIKSVFTVTICLIPIVILIFLYGEKLLYFINKDYADAFVLLKLIVLSSFFAAIHMIYISIQNVRVKVDNIVKINLLRFMLLLILSYSFMHKFNIIGVGYAWLVTYSILFILITAQFKKEGLLQAAGRGKGYNG